VGVLVQAWAPTAVEASCGVGRRLGWSRTSRKFIFFSQAVARRVSQSLFAGVRYLPSISFRRRPADSLYLVASALGGKAPFLVMALRSGNPKLFWRMATEIPLLPTADAPGL